MKKIFVIVFAVLVGCAPVAIAKSIVSPTVTATPFVLPVLKETPIPTATPRIITPTPSPTPTGEYVVQPGDTLAKIAKDLGVTVTYLAFENGIQNPNLIFPGQKINRPPWPPKPDTLDKEIIVELSTQQVFVYENGVLLKIFLVSTGVAAHPTVLGHFNIYVKYESTTMTDHATYYLKHVPWTMYFYQGYGLHGTYWHHNFGHPMSHGCVNMYTPDAEWLYGWAEVGTNVWVIP